MQRAGRRIIFTAVLLLATTELMAGPYIVGAERAPATAGSEELPSRQVGVSRYRPPPSPYTSPQKPMKTRQSAALALEICERVLRRTSPGLTPPTDMSPRERCTQLARRSEPGFSITECERGLRQFPMPSARHALASIDPRSRCQRYGYDVQRWQCIDTHTLAGEPMMAASIACGREAVRRQLSNRYPR